MRFICTTGCQFTFTCDGAMNRAPRGRNWDTSQKVAAHVLMNLNEERTGGATHYHATYVDPIWSAGLIKTDKIGIVNNELAFEMGSTNVTGPEGKSRTTQFSANFVKRNDKWMLLSVHELPDRAPSNYEKLKGLEWLAGNWTTRDPASKNQNATVIAVSCYWSTNQNFLIREFTSATDGEISNMGTQRIGGHAPTKSIRSWSFDFKGGSVIGVWKADGKKWLVNTREALNNGQELTSIEILSQGPNGEQVWEVTDQMIGEQAFPNNTYTFRRQN